MVTAASTFGPWLHSGRTVRNSYGVARALDRLDVAHGLVGSAVGGLWSFVPLLAALVVLGAVVRRPLAVAAGGVALGLGVAVFAAGVLASPFPPGWGAYLGIVGSTVTFAAALHGVGLRWRSRTPDPR